MVQTCVNSENGLGSCLKPQLRPHLVKFNEVFRKCRYDNNKNFIFNANFVAVRKLSGSCQAVVRQLSGSYQAVVRQQSGNGQAIVRQQSQAIIKLSKSSYIVQPNCTEQLFSLFIRFSSFSWKGVFQKSSNCNIYLLHPLQSI